MQRGRRVTESGNEAPQYGSISWWARKQNRLWMYSGRGIHKSQRKALEMVLPAAAKAAVTQQRNDQVRELIGQKSAQIIKEFKPFTWGARSAMH